MRSRIDDAIFEGTQLHRGAQFKEYAAATLTGGITLPETSHSLQVYDPGGGARNVDLPAASASNRGRIWWFVNLADAAENLVVRNNGGATALTLGAGKIGLVIQAGTVGAPQTPGYIGSPLP